MARGLISVLVSPRGGAPFAVRARNPMEFFRLSSGMLLSDEVHRASTLKAAGPAREPYMPGATEQR
eukprot:6202690-Pleurochrysis_carterae.AAC.2